MPRDPRLYMTFPNDIHRHPKIIRLTPEVRWAFIEMNGEARIADNDGVFAAEDAEFEWGRETLDALVSSHPTRPLVVRRGNTYVIRDYAEHQETRQAREERRARNAANGAKGGRPRKNPGVTESVSSANPDLTDSKPNRTQTKAESESESESELERPTKTSRGPSSNTPPESATDASSRAVLSGSSISPDRLISHIGSRTNLTVNATTAMKVALDILSRADNVKDNQKYVLGSITRNPAETEKFIYDNNLAD